ncbi:MAG: ABC transporter permease, partial [Betaproteobacteria bacterium]
MPRFLLDLAWRDLRAGGRPLVVFALCLMLGVALVSAGGVLHRQLATALQTEVRALFGGDVEVQSDRALPTDERAWWAARGRVAEVQQLRTMLRGPDGRSQLVELMSADAAYPLVGELKLEPAQPLADALALKDGRHGIAVDPVLAQRLGLARGRAVELGDLTLEVRALIRHQPDRSLRAEWRGAPVLVSDAALAASGLVQPASRLEHKLRVALPAGAEPGAARRAFFAAFPRSSAELRTVADRSDRIGELLGQVASGLLLVGFTALFIGGLGVFNSVQAYLQGKLATWATLRAVGLRDAALARLVLLQVLMLALTSSAVGVALGLGLALAALGVAAEQLPLAWAPWAAVVPALLGLGFGVMTALVFAWPAVARALSVSPAALFRGVDGTVLQT